MSISIAFLQETPRASQGLVAHCYAMPALFLPWEELSPAARQEFTTHGPIPCEGSGAVGVWCQSCRFGELVEV